MTSTMRLRRAAVAERLLSASPQAAAVLDWDALDRVPAWLALADAAFATFQCRVGAVLCSRVLRLWIDRRRLAAAQAALGAPFLCALLAERDSDSIPLGLFACPEIDSPLRVEPMLRLAGASVLLATLPDGVPRDAIGALLAPATASCMAPELALALVARAESLDAPASAQAASRGAAPEGAAS